MSVYIILLLPFMERGIHTVVLILTATLLLRACEALVLLFPEIALHTFEVVLTETMLLRACEALLLRSPRLEARTIYVVLAFAMLFKEYTALRSLECDRLKKYILVLALTLVLTFEKTALAANSLLPFLVSITTRKGSLLAVFADNQAVGKPFFLQDGSTQSPPMEIVHGNLNTQRPSIGSFEVHRRGRDWTRQKVIGAVLDPSRRFERV